MAAPTHAQLATPDLPLAKAVTHFYCVQQASREAALPQQLLPTYQLLLVLNLGAAVPVWYGEQAGLIQNAALLGPIRQVLRYELPPGADLLVVNFSWTGFYRLFGLPVPQLESTWFHPVEALPNGAELPTLRHQLAGQAPGPERIALLNQWLQRASVPHPPAVLALLDSLTAVVQNDVLGTRRLAPAPRLSMRSLQLRYQTYLGCSLKELLRFVRFERLVKALPQQAAVVDWQTLLAAFDYHDQSHLIRDFRRFSGRTPRRLLVQLHTNQVSLSQSGPFQ